MSESPTSKSEFEFIDAIVDGVLASAESVEAFSAWVLGGTAASIALFASNVDRLSAQFGALWLRLILLSLLVSALFGVLSKRAAVQIREGRALRNSALQNLNKLADPVSGDIRLVAPYLRNNVNMREAVGIFGKVFLKKIRPDEFLAEEIDHLDLLRKKVTPWLRQKQYLKVQMFFLFQAGLLVALGI